MRKIVMGIINFREHLLPRYEARFRELAEEQAPDALLITCSDSRLLPDVLASVDPGELFVMRNVGNLIPPATVYGDSTGDLSEASAIEYSVLVLKVRHLIVCGHSQCGAMKAALARKPLPEVLVQLEHLASYPIVRARLADGSLHLSGWWFDIARGDMLAYQRETRSFESIDRAMAERMLSRLEF
jgi:carbonic anhydrase